MSGRDIPSPPGPRSLGEAELVLDARAQLGEGPSWDAARGRLVWVDILPGLVHLFDPLTGLDETFDVGRPVGAAIPAAGGGIVVCRQGEVGVLDPASGEVRLLALVPGDPALLMNDAKCDRAGRLWAGTMALDAATGAGTLYRLDPGGALTAQVEAVSISNGLGWSLDDRTMYYIDTATQAVDAFDYEPGTGAVSRRRHLVEIPPEVGMPDGMCVDAEGYLWVALWEGWSVRRYAPDGRLDAVVDVPAARVTSCCFGGAGLGDLYITSAAPGPEPLARPQPHAGGLFRARPGVAGLPTDVFRDEVSAFSGAFVRSRGCHVMYTATI